MAACTKKSLKLYPLLFTDGLKVIKSFSISFTNQHCWHKAKVIRVFVFCFLSLGSSKNTCVFKSIYSSPELNSSPWSTPQLNLKGRVRSIEDSVYTIFLSFLCAVEKELCYCLCWYE